MIEFPTVDTLLAGPLGAWLESKRDTRAKLLAEFKHKLLLGGGAAVVTFLILLIFSSFDTAKNLAFMVLAGFVFWGGIGINGLVSEVKTSMNDALAKAIGFTYTEKGTPGPEYKLAHDFGLFPKFYGASIEDFWSGTLDGRPFRLYEVTLTSNSEDSNKTIFCGPLIQLQFARPFLGTTLVQRDESHASIFEYDSIAVNNQKLARARMVDPKFEKTFTVWSNDAVEARYLVHPVYCERLLALERQFLGKNLRALFHKGEVLITLDTGNLFESGGLDSSEDRENLVRTIEQFAMLAELAHALDERARNSPAQAASA